MRLFKVKVLVSILFCMSVLLYLPLAGHAYYGGLGGLLGGFYQSPWVFNNPYSLYGGLGLYSSPSWYGIDGFGPYGYFDYGLSSLSYAGLYPYVGLGSIYGLYNGLYGWDTLDFGFAPGLMGLGFGWPSYWGGGLGLGTSYGTAADALINTILDSTRTSSVLTTTGGGGGLNPTGTWTGTWLSYISLKGGIMNMNLLYSSLTGTVSGTAGLLLNKLIPIPINVSGPYTGAIFTLTGSYLNPVSLVTYYEELTCTMITSSFMTGDYIIHDLLYTKTDIGEFNVNLTVTPVI